GRHGGQRDPHLVGHGPAGAASTAAAAARAAARSAWTTGNGLPPMPYWWPFISLTTIRTVAMSVSRASAIASDTPLIIASILATGRPSSRLIVTSGMASSSPRDDPARAEPVELRDHDRPLRQVDRRGQPAGDHRRPGGQHGPAVVGH